jgi:hypothetical protein
VPYRSTKTNSEFPDEQLKRSKNLRKIHTARLRNQGSFKSSQVKLLITNNAFCIVQRATAQSKTGIFRDDGVAEAPRGF